MEFALIIVFIAVIFGIVSIFSRDQNQKTTKKSTPKAKKDHIDNEDPYLGIDLSNGRQIENLGNHPFITILEREGFLYTLSEEEKQIAEKIINYKSDEVIYAINKMINHSDFREKSGLPKYLQIIPIDKFISESIFVYPDENDLKELLESLTMNLLREICKNLDISAARSKSETVDRLLNHKDDININFSNYFKLNPIILNLSAKADQVIEDYLEDQIDQIPIKIKPIQGLVSDKEIREVEQKGDYKIAQYGYGSVIYYQNNDPLFRVLGYSMMDKFSPSVYLLSNGLITLTNAIGIRNTTIRYFVFINSNMESVHQSRVDKVNYLEPSIIEDKNIIYVAREGGFWVMNYFTLEEKIIPNPDGKDIYTVLDDE